MSQANARLFKAAAALAATGAMVLATTGAADAGTTSSGSHIPVIHVDVTTDGGFSLPATVQSGLVTFEIVAQDTASHAVQGFRVKPGSTVEEVMHDFDLGLLGDFPDRALGARGLLEHAVLVGGAVTFPFRAISVTMPLEPGTYHFFDLGDLGERPTRIQTIEAVGNFRFSLPPRVDATVLTYSENGEPRFLTPRSLSATGTFLYVNTGDEIHEVVFRPTRAGITDDYITEFYNAVLAGGALPQSPWTGVQSGLQAISPGRWTITKLDLPPGPYAEICYVPDEEIGIPHAYEGMHVMVDLT